MKWWALWFLHFVANISARIYRENMDRTQLTRRTTFSPEVKYKVCLLRPQEGPCRSKITMYYFKKSIMSCAPFDWGGCQGNGNRFDTERECLNYCLSRPGYKPPRPYWCQLSFEYGTCFGEVDVYYFDNRWQVCKKAKYSGCGGNDNNFKTHAECEAVCLLGLGDTTPYGQATADHGFSTVLVVDPEDAPTRRGRDTQTTTRNPMDGEDGKPGLRRYGKPGQGRDGESGRGKDSDSENKIEQPTEKASTRTE